MLEAVHVAHLSKLSKYGVTLRYQVTTFMLQAFPGLTHEDAYAIIMEYKSTHELPEEKAMPRGARKQKFSKKKG